MNSTILDAQSLGFTLPSTRGEDKYVPPASMSRISPNKNDFRRKQMIAYHGWLRSKANKTHYNTARAGEFG